MITVYGPLVTSAFAVNVKTPLPATAAKLTVKGGVPQRVGVADAMKLPTTVINTVLPETKFVWVVKATVIGAPGALVILSNGAMLKLTPVMMPPRAPELKVPGLSVDKVRVSVTISKTTPKQMHMLAKGGGGMRVKMGIRQREQQKQQGNEPFGVLIKIVVP
jgi:hypothetical protein